MEYRALPHGTPQERFSTLGLGMGGIQAAPAGEIQQVVETAIAHGINFFDLCAGGASVYAPFGKAIAPCRDKVFFQLHLGAVYNEAGEYGWSRDVSEIQKTLHWELQTMGTDYADFIFLHCVDEPEDAEALISGGILKLAQNLKTQGVARHLGFSSHTPAVAHRLLDTGLMDMMMFSINPAYDLEQGDEYGVGQSGERAALFRRCQQEGVGISVMKPFFAGKLLSDTASPFRQAMTHNQCLQYVLDRPGVLSAVPGVRSMDDLRTLLGFVNASPESRDYADLLARFAPAEVLGSCVYCNHCQPCPAGIDIGLVNKYYDLAKAGDKLAASHYTKLSVNASACLACGHCTVRCPFRVDQQARMAEIAQYFGE